MKESEFIWNPISTQVQLELVYKVHRTQVHLQDLAVNFDDLTELENSSVFRLEY